MKNKYSLREIRCYQLSLNDGIARIQFDLNMSLIFVILYQQFWLYIRYSNVSFLLHFLSENYKPNIENKQDVCVSNHKTLQLQATLNLKYLWWSKKISNFYRNKIIKCLTFAYRIFLRNEENTSNKSKISIWSNT